MRYNFDPTNNLPPDFKDYSRWYKEIKEQASRAFRAKRVEPLTDAELEARAEAFAYIDEYDKRSRGQQFQ